MKQITIYLHLEEQIDDTLTAFWKTPVGRTETEDHKAFAELLGFRDDENGIRLGKDVGKDLAKFEERLDSVSDRKEFTVKKTGALSYRLTRKIKQPREVYQFPAGSFPGLDNTRWGPTDFYDSGKAAIAAAFRSGLDFETPWLSCKKEILSSRIIRSKNRVLVEVSVSDDFDTPGAGDSSFGVNRATTEESFFDKLERAGGEAHGRADDNRHDNQDYLGYSVGKVDKDGNFSWALTYLANIAGLDYPPGDNYFRWGWQEVSDRNQETPDALPPAKEIPAKVAREIARLIEEDYPETVEVGGYRAKRWKD
jgi:hypothetical protein